VGRGLVILLVLLGGVAGGFVLSELIGIVGYLAAGRAIGIRYLPLILPIVGLGGALLVLRNEKLRKSQ
jgi:hypothetical protein